MKSKLLVTNHHEEFARDIGVDCSEPQITDQSFKNDCDVNIIMKNYAKTGVLPQALNMGDYIDVTEIPQLEEAFAISRRATEMFMELPADVRALINHDPTQLENLINNPEYHDILKKHGILKFKEELKKTDEVIQPSIEVSKNEV